MKTDMKKVDKRIKTQETKALVKTYLLTRAHAELIRKQVSKIERRVLKENEFFFTSKRYTRRGITDKRIKDPSLVYQGDYERFAEIMDEQEDFKQLKRANLPAEYVDVLGYCPACWAEELQNKAENALIKWTGKPFNITGPTLTASSGLDGRQGWIDNVTSAAIAVHDIDNP